MRKGTIDYWAGGHFVVVDFRDIGKISNVQKPYLLKVPQSDRHNENAPNIVRYHQYLSSKLPSVLPAWQMNCVGMPHAPGELVLNIQDKNKKEYAMELARSERTKIEQLGFTNTDIVSEDNLFFDGKQVYIIDLSAVLWKQKV